MGSKSTPSKLQINITGSGHTIRKAERGILILKASSEENTLAKATEAATKTANQVRETITPYCPRDETTGETLQGAAIAHYSMTTIDTSIKSTLREGTGKDNIQPIYDRTFTSRAEFHIKFADFTVLDLLATEFATMNGISISCVTWHLTDRTLESIRGTARKLAAHDAIQRACDYAAVFAGLEDDQMGRVRAVDVKEDSYYAQSTRPQLHYGKGQRRGVATPNAFQFEPEDVRLDVKVTATFVVDEE